MKPLAVTEASFEREVIQSEMPVLIDFHADWCQPCKQQSPIVEEVARELEGKLKVVTIDVDKNPRVAAAFRIQAIPQLFVMVEGQVAAHWDKGLASKPQVLALVKPFLPASANELAPKDLAQLLKDKRVLPVDLREPAVFARYHIPGAINIPASEIETRIADLVPRDGRVRVLYGRTNDEGKDLAEKLMKAGQSVGFLTGGFLHWEADGLEVERGLPN
jgi:thioredoxin 1